MRGRAVACCPTEAGGRRPAGGRREATAKNGGPFTADDRRVAARAFSVDVCAQAQLLADQGPGGRQRGGDGGGGRRRERQNPFDGFVTPRGSPWAPAPLEAEGAGGGAEGEKHGSGAKAAATLAAAPCTSGGVHFRPPQPAPPQIRSSSSSFRSYLHGELHPTPSLPTADVAWGQTERQRVYNALLAVPLHLERLLLLGRARVRRRVAGGADAAASEDRDGGGRWGRWFLVEGRTRRRRGRRSRKKKKTEGVAMPTAKEKEPKPAPLLLPLLPPTRAPSSTTSSPSSSSPQRPSPAAPCPSGRSYFWMKDMTQEFLKLHVIYTAVDILDKIACSFSVDALDALAGTCALIAAAPPRRTGRKSGGEAAANEAAMRTPRSSAANASSSSSSAPPSPSRLSLVPHLLADALVAGAIVTAHAFILLAHGVALSVAMHSKRGSTLLALTFASNFVEIKSAVFKRYDGRKLYTLACQDCVERFHLLAALAFVLVEAAAAGEAEEEGSAAEASPQAAVGGLFFPLFPASSFSFWSRPDALLLTRCGHVFAAEVAIDVIKHAVLTKFNEVQARDVPRVRPRRRGGGGRRRRAGQSHVLYRRLLFDPLAPPRWSCGCW